MVTVCGLFFFHSTLVTQTKVHEIIRGFLSVKKGGGGIFLAFFFCLVEVKLLELASF